MVLSAPVFACINGFRAWVRTDGGCRAGLTYNVQKLLMEMDSELYDRCAQQHEEMQAQAEAKAATAKRNWDDIANSIS